MGDGSSEFGKTFGITRTSDVGTELLEALERAFPWQAVAVDQLTGTPVTPRLQGH